MSTKTKAGNFASSARARVAGIVAAVPSNNWTNADVRGAVEVERLTGIMSRRRIWSDQTCESLCWAAARKLLTKLNWDPADINLLVYVTQTPSKAMPATAFNLQSDLGLSTACVVLPLNLSCAGYVAGLWTTMRMLMQGGKALLLVGDAMTPILDPADRATYPIFGDAGSATAIEYGAYSHGFVMGSTGVGNTDLDQEHGKPLHMNGSAVFSFSLARVPPMVEDLLSNRATPDLILFHQANKFMLDHLVKKMDLTGRFPGAAIPSNIAQFGNCSSASIPLLIASSCARIVERGCTAAMFGFGAGWQWAGAYMDLHDVEVVELLEVS